MNNRGIDRQLLNYIRIHRRRSGLSQSELGWVLGYDDEETVSRHERFQVTPPLEIAISYEIVFRIPITELFPGLRDQVEAKVEASLAALEQQIGQQSTRDRNAHAAARKLMWLSARREANTEARA